MGICGVHASSEKEQGCAFTVHRRPRRGTSGRPPSENTAAQRYQPRLQSFWILLRVLLHTAVELALQKIRPNECPFRVSPVSPQHQGRRGIPTARHRALLELTKNEIAES